MKKLSLYLETSVISFLVARPSSNVVTLASQQITLRWWEYYRSRYNLFVSEEVIREIADGNPTAAAQCLSLIHDIPILRINPTIRAMADHIIAHHALPQKAQADALHVAVASTFHLDLLLTWNMRHLANPKTIPQLRTIISAMGYRLPELCNPHALLEVDDARK